MEFLVHSHHSDWAAEACKAAPYLDGITVHPFVDVFLLTEDQCPTACAPGLAPRALEQMDIAIGVLDDGIAERAIIFLVMALVVCRLVANRFVALRVWTGKLSEAAFKGCVLLHHLSPHFLFTTSTVVRTFDDQAVQLRANQSY